MAETLKDKAARGLMWAGLNNSTMQVLNAIFGIVLARRLNQEDYGLIGMVAVFSVLATALQDSGFVTALINRRDARHEDFNSVFWFNISVSFLLYLLLCMCAPLIADFYHEPLLTPLSRYYFLCFFVASFNIVPRAILSRQIRQKELAIMGLISLIVSGSVGITMVYMGMAYWGLASQTLIFNVCVTVISWAMSGWRPSLKITFQPVREMFGFSSKMLITNIVNQINNNIFSLVLGKFYTKVEVGTYNQANKWNTMGASTITGMVQGVAQPTFVQVGDDRERLCRAFSKMLRFTSFVSFPAMFGLAMVAPEFIEVFITDKWASSARLMQYLCVAGAFLPLSTLYFNMIISRGKSNVYMWNVIAQGLVILTSILGVKYAGYGVTEMVLAYVAIVILWMGVWHSFVKREIGFAFIDALRDVLPSMMVAVFTMIVIYLLTTEVENIYLLLVVRIVLATALYLAVHCILGASILKECVGYLRH